MISLGVIPAKAGIQILSARKSRVWIPAFAGMTMRLLPEPGTKLANNPSITMCLMSDASVKVFDSPFPAYRMHSRGDELHGDFVEIERCSNYFFSSWSAIPNGG